MKYLITLFCLITFSAQLYSGELPSSAQDNNAYLGKWVPALHQCQVIDFKLLRSGGDPYLIAECDVKNTKERSIRIWRTRYAPNTPSKQYDVKIYGEIILPWQHIKDDDYWLLLCREKSKDEFSLGGFIRVGASKASKQNGLLYFAERENGAIEQVLSSKIAECDMPESGG